MTAESDGAPNPKWDRIEGVYWIFSGLVVLAGLVYGLLKNLTGGG